MNINIVKSIFKINNFFDEIAIIDKDGIIRYCEIFVPNVYSFTADEIVGKHIFEVFQSSSEENSEIYEVLQTGKPISSFEENCITYKGDVVQGYSSVYPVYKKGELQGAAVALKFLDNEYSKERIEILEHDTVKSRKPMDYTIDDIITNDPSMFKIKKFIERAAYSNSPVLIQGATGTGKELVAQALHCSGQRDGKPFVSQNCSAIPDNLLESTLFGTEKGSFTGAVTGKGLFELANGGTLFLDEINSMNMAAQTKLLKAIEEKRFRRLGGHENIYVDIRIIAAINEEPFRAIEEKRLRQDLFYRLNVISMELPVLTERGNDIDFLTQYFLEEYNRQMDKTVCGLSEEVRELFHNYSWPGNVRELRNVIEGAFNVMEGKQIEMDQLPGYFIRQSESEKSEVLGEETEINTEWDYDKKLLEYEKSLLKRALDKHKTKTAAAKSLGLTKQGLNYKLDKFSLK